MIKTSLGEITVRIFDGKHGDCVNEKGSGLYFISVKDLEEHEINYDNAREVTKKDFVQNYCRTLLEEGDTIYANTGDTIGKSVFIKNNPLVFCTSFQKSIAVLKPKNEIIIPRYLYYLLKYETPRLRKAATGSGQKNLLLSTMREFPICIHSLNEQKKIVEILGDIDDKIQNNNKINDILEKQTKILYDYWFTQFDFPDEKGRPYTSSGGMMVWNEKIKRNLPLGWKVQTMTKNDLASIIKPGIKTFLEKTYYSTSEVIGTKILTGNKIKFDTRESRANMQPTINSVWFAKMKNSIKHLFLNKDIIPIINTSILSTGFCGLQCSKESFEYIASFIASPHFENTKNILSHGATQQAINNSDLTGIYLLIPNKQTLLNYHNITKKNYSKINKNILENIELAKLRDWLLPILMNGQATVSE